MIRDKFKLGDIVALKADEISELIPNSCELINDCYVSKDYRAIIVGYGRSKFVTFLKDNYKLETEEDDIAFGIMDDGGHIQPIEDNDRWVVVGHHDMADVIQSVK